MAVSVATVPNILAYTYNRDRYIAPHERFMTKFYDGVQDWPQPPGAIGRGRVFEVVTADSHAAGGVAESASLPEFNDPTVINCTLTAIEIAASLQFSELIAAVGKEDGLVSKVDVIDRFVRMTTRNFMSALNRHTLGHGTGRMAVIQDTTDTLTTFVCRNPESLYQLRVGMTIDFYDTDTSGSKQGNTETISALNFETRTVTIGNARTLTAGWGVYKNIETSTPTSEYGVAVMGLRGMADNGTLAATYHAQLRATYPALNATVLSSAGSYSEKLVRKSVNRIRFQTDLDPDEIWCNEGIIGEHLNHLTGNRMYTISGDGVPSYQIGQQESKLGFMTGGKLIPFKVDRDLPNGEFIVCTKSLFRRHIARKANWIGDGISPDGSEAPFFMQTPGTATYKLSKTGGMLWIGNLAHLQPKALTRTTGVGDEELAGDAASIV